MSAASAARLPLNDMTTAILAHKEACMGIGVTACYWFFLRMQREHGMDQKYWGTPIRNEKNERWHFAIHMMHYS
jgi:hypothetical protein